MNLLTYAYLFCAFLFFESAITVFRLHRDAALNRSGASALFLMSMYALVYGLYLAAPSAPEAVALFKLLWAVTFSAVAVMLHFCLILARLDRLAGSLPFLAAMYAVPALLAAGMTAGAIGAFDFHRTPWGWECVDRVPLATTAYLPYVFMMSYALAGFAAIFVRGHVAKDPTERKQVLAVTGFTSMSFACIAIPTLVFSLAGARLDARYTLLWSNLGVITFLLIWLSGLRYTMKKYRLLILLPDEPVGQVFGAMDTGMLMVDSGGAIAFANAEAAALIPDARGKAASLRGKIFRELFADPSVLFDVSESFTRKAYRQASRVAVPLHAPLLPSGPPGKPKPLELSMYPMFDEKDRYIGCVVMLLAMGHSEHAAEFQARFSISDRENEITLLLVQGLSNKQIAERLFISPGTVKNHVFNIYEKTGVRNRVELTRLLDQA